MSRWNPCIDRGRRRARNAHGTPPERYESGARSGNYRRLEKSMNGIAAIVVTASVITTSSASGCWKRKSRGSEQKYVFCWSASA